MNHINWKTGLVGLLLIISLVVVALSKGQYAEVSLLGWSGHQDRDLSAGGNDPFFTENGLLLTGGRGSDYSHAGIQFWNIETGELQRVLPTQSFARMGLSPDQHWFFTGGDGSPFGEFHLWSLQTGEHLLKQAYPRYWSILGFTKDSEHLLRVIQGRLELWHFPTNRVIYSIELPTIRLRTDLTWSPDRKRLLFGLFDNTEYRLLDVETGVMQTVPLQLPPGRPKLFSDDGSALAVATEEAVKVFDVATWSYRFSCEFSRREGGRGEQEPIYFSPNRNLLVMTSGGKHSYDFNACDASGKRLSRIIAHNYGWALSPDGELLALSPGNDDRRSLYSVELWNTRTGQLVRTLCSRLCYGVSPQLDTLTFSPDVHWLVVTSNGTIDLWDLHTAARSPHTLLHPCNNPKAPACGNLATTARKSDTTLTPRPQYLQGCTTEPLPCLLRGVQEVDVPGVAAPVPAFYKACALGHPEGCYTMAYDLSLRAKTDRAQPPPESLPGLCHDKTRRGLLKPLELEHWSADARGGAIPIFALPPTHPWAQHHIHPGDVIALVNGEIPWRFNVESQLEQVCNTPTGLALTIYRFQDATTVTLVDKLGRRVSTPALKEPLR